VNYQELLVKRQKTYSEFVKGRIFFAFSKKQFDENISKIGIELDEIDQVGSVGGGGYCRKSDIQGYIDLLIGMANEMEEALKDRGFLLGALTYELGNHEFNYTRDPGPALEALGLKIEDVPVDVLREAKQVAGQIDS